MKRNLYIIFAITLSSLMLACAVQKNHSDSRTIYLLRHAEKNKNVKDPSLTESGLARAMNLAEILQDSVIKAIYSTDYRRTKETVTPLSEKVNLPIEYYNPRDLKAFANYLNDESKGNIVVVGHSNTTPQLINLILDEKRYEDLSEDEYGDLYIINLRGSRATVSETKF